MRHSPDQPIVFLCNICDRQNEAALDRLTRDEPSCSKCGSSVRMRSIVQILTTELFGHSMPLSRIPCSPHLAGIGMSCWDGYAGRLARKLAYTNTFYHQAPRFDIARGDASLRGRLDFVVSSDVFEHVDPPVSSAFAHTADLLKPDGVFVFSVPFGHVGVANAPTQEHFPELYKYDIRCVEGHYRLTNTTRAGELQTFDDLVFHGGPGSTLELRVFSEWSVLEELDAAGFRDVTLYSGSDLRHGIHWNDGCSVPIAARLRPAPSAGRS